MSLNEAISNAEAVLPGIPAPAGARDPRWQAIIDVAEFIATNPDDVWAFAARWGSHEQADVRAAIATCLLEHLLESHFDLVFPRVEQMALRDRHFATTVSMCWKFGQSSQPSNAERFDRLLREIRTS